MTPSSACPAVRMQQDKSPGTGKAVAMYGRPGHLGIYLRQPLLRTSGSCELSNHQANLFLAADLRHLLEAFMMAWQTHHCGV